VSGLAGLLAWDGRPVAASLIERMLERIAHRGPDGRACRTGPGVGLGQARLDLGTRGQGGATPLRDEARGLVIAADARLYDREELARRLGLEGAAPPDPALLLAAYAKWGEDLLRWVDGDFAFAIWDERRRRLFAARDPFGVKPFFYAYRAGWAAFGSEPKQLLHLPFVRPDLDDLVIGEFLFQKFEDTRHTFFADVRRLRPAHCLVMTAEGVTERRYWNPDPEGELDLGDSREYADVFHHLFRQSVARRLEGARPVGLQLSGGFDSSSVVATAGELQEKGIQRLPPILTLSARFPGLDCDESPYIDAVSRSVPFPHQDFEPLTVPLLEGLEEDFRRIDSPFADLARGLFVHCMRALDERGGRLLVTGIGGDELVHEEHYLHDLARRGRWVALLREARRGSATSWNSWPWLVRDALRSAAPESVKAVYRSLFRRRYRPPAWADPDFARAFLSLPEAPPPATMGFRSLTQEKAFQFLTHPAVGWAIEALEARASHHGVEVRHPFLDRPLAEFVLSIPFSRRAFGGRWKRLLRDAMGERLPSVVRRRPRKTAFSSMERAVLKAAAPRLREAIGVASRWLSTCYVMPEAARRFLEQADTAAGLAVAETSGLWRVLCLELWLRSRTQG
jgi:asparagine synthase (glutamine-hydrolysing)